MEMEGLVGYEMVRLEDERLEELEILLVELRKEEAL
jgi:hypothetical protein